MSCGKQVRLVKKWDKPRKIEVIKPSKYEKTPVAVRTHWRNVIKALELSYKDEKFWETQSDKVRELVGPKIFKRLEKIFNLPPRVGLYEPKSDVVSRQASHEFYHRTHVRKEAVLPTTCSATDFDESLYKNDIEELAEEESERWSTSTNIYDSVCYMPSNRVSLIRSRSSVGRSGSAKGSKYRTWSSVKSWKPKASYDVASSYFDDLIVHHSRNKDKEKSSRAHNPHHHMLYCSESETDMIKWNSKYKQKKLEVSASDEYSRRAEILTKTIAKDFYDWWVSLGSLEFKSEIKRAEDIEELFQLWFDEHASRELKLDHKIVPCVLKSISEYTGIKKASCSEVLKQQIANDIHAETKPAHTVAFASSLPQKLKHLPPKNNTKELWGPVPIPEDLKSMTCVWGDIQHLTSTKAFLKWMKQKPDLRIPPFLQKVDKGGKKLPYTVPSDYVQAEKTKSDLAVLASKLSIDLSKELSNLMS
ncbi:uncharacterized protein LOC121728816 [Aricia agestis]|uniref:uncharacterized protein LOC121728816 n=1 Tax=Aricia agestis TaxID=91739 RepID=UPI001C204DD1|nr:uncharacterized protein LOC121728816 [Aricia agestis]